LILSAEEKSKFFSAEQTGDGIGNWYEGTADAVRKNLRYFGTSADGLVVILSGDQLYRMEWLLNIRSISSRDLISS
jgi:ADP-glucose pyrophosphorylase